MNTISAPSPNFTKGRKKPVTTVVVHYTGSDSAAGTISWFLNPSSKVSAHYVIGKFGEVYKCVDLSDIAWHAGLSYGPNGWGVNSYSVGVELVGTGDRYPQVQIDALVRLLKELKASMPGLKWLTGHDQICWPKGRKADPGPNFHLLNVAGSAGLKVWLRGDGKDQRP